MNKIRSEQEIKKLLSEYSSSGLSKVDFCKEKKVALQTLYYWLKNPEKTKKKTNNKEPLNFIPVHLDEKNSKIKIMHENSSEKISLKTSTGIFIEFPLSIQIQWLSSLIKELS